ncbi:hypothetical protein PQ125_002657 [Salmonella enterica]|nr:hypothetical protein [Salmonella enterica]
MIYIHSYGVGKFGSKQIRNIHDTHDEALAKQRVLGGVIQAFESVENLGVNEQIKEIVVDEVACIIDDFSTKAPGSARELEPGSSEWDLYKVGALNRLRELLAEI